MEAIGRRRWAIPEGYIPSESSYSDRDLVSHETACIINAGDRDAHVAITIFFADWDRLGRIASPSPAGTRCICASTIWMNRSRFRAIPTMPPSSNPTFRSSCNTRGSIPVASRLPFCRPLLIRKTDSDMANLAFYFSSLWRAEVRNFSHRNTLRQERVLVERKI